MTILEYQNLAVRTMKPVTGIRSDDRHDRMVLALGLAGEAGELLEIIKKHEGHNHPLDHAKLSEEIGDLLWYVAAVATSYGVLLDDVAEKNIAKLKARYPDGFTTRDSIARVDSVPSVPTEVTE